MFVLELRGKADIQVHMFNQVWQIRFRLTALGLDAPELQDLYKALSQWANCFEKVLSHWC